MTSFYYHYQDLSGFRFLVLIRAFVIQTSLALQNLNMKGKTKRILVGDFKICNTEDDGCTVETYLEN